MNAVEFLALDILFGVRFCVPEVCIALVADLDQAEQLRDVKLAGTELTSRKLFSPEKFSTLI